MKNNKALAVMLRPPAPGEVKTRLVPPLTPDEAAGLYRAFIVDTFSSLAGLENIDIHAFIAPHSRYPFSVDEAEIHSYIPEGIPVTMQKGRDLGERICNVFQALLTGEGYAKVAVIGSDSPDIPIEYIDEAYGFLDELSGGIVLGPADDGGYYLIAMDTLRKALFREIPWSTDHVLEVTMERSLESDVPFKLLSKWYDIDKPEDILKLADNPDAPGSSIYIRENRLLDKLE